MPERRRIAFITSLPQIDRRSWSGTLYFMLRSLDKHCGDAEVVSVSSRLATWLFKQGFRVNSYSKRFHLKNYNLFHSTLLAKVYQSALTQKMKNSDYDIVFAPIAATEVAFSKCRQPVIYSSDATFHLMCDYHPYYTNLSALSRWEGNRLESLAIEKSAISIFSSTWAANSAINDYGKPQSRVKVIKYGANLDQDDVLARDLVSARKVGDCCRLLLVGVDWYRKGADIAMDALIALLNSGVDSRLTVVGCMPPAGVQHPRLTILPFLDKNIPEQRKEMSRLLLEHDFMILPTRNECSAISFCEAASYGLPVITTDTGGVSSVVADGRTGHCLPYSAIGEDYALVIKRIWENPEAYQQMVVQSRNEYDMHLNWDSWGHSMAEVCDYVTQ